MCVYGDLLFFGLALTCERLQKNYNRDEEEQEQGEFSNLVARMIQKQHHEATAVSPVSLVAAVVLFGRTSGGITMGKILPSYINR